MNLNRSELYSYMVCCVYSDPDVVSHMSHALWERLSFVSLVKFMFVINPCFPYSPRGRRGRYWQDKVSLNNATYVARDMNALEQNSCSINTYSCRHCLLSWHWVLLRFLPHALTTHYRPPSAILSGLDNRQLSTMECTRYKTISCFLPMELQILL